MVSIYECTEPLVINQELLTKAVEEERPDGEAGRIILKDGKRFSDVTSLTLNFKHILKIENLWNFKSLVRLNLDNNLIEKIEGLDLLVNLKWLDLSFNNIDVIEGLSNLRKLEDLTLFSNNITKLQNLESLTHLQVFSIGNNNLADIDNVMVLHKLNNLQTLNLAGNPLAYNPNYKLYLTAFLPQIQFLDYRLIDDQTRKASLEKYSNAVEDLNNKDRTFQAQKEQEAKLLTERELLNHAFVTPLHNRLLFTSLFEGDKAANLFLHLDGVEKIQAQFEYHFSVLTDELYELGLSSYYARTAEEQLFMATLHEAQDINQNASAEAVDQFLQYKGETCATFTVTDEATNEESSPLEFNPIDLLEEWRTKIAQLWDYLMEAELHLLNQIEEAIKEFDRTILEMINTTCEQIQAICTQMRDHEVQFSEQLSDVAGFFLEKILREEEIASDNMRDYFIDKDALSGVLAVSHDSRTVIIDNVEDGMLNGIKTWKKQLMEQLQRDEIQRNRQRILEINHFIDCHLSELDEVENLFIEPTESREE